MTELLNIASKYPFIGTLVTFITGLLLMPFVIKFAKKNNLVVRPNKRTAHNGIVPNIGGLDIFLSLMLVFVILIIFNRLDFALLIGFCLLFIIGFIDDMLVLSAFWKLAGETLAAFFLIYLANIRITSFYGIFGIEELPLIWSYALSYLLYIIIVNALNLIDGIDGLASGLGVIYCLFFGFWFYLIGYEYNALFCFSAVGSLIVFFLYNVFGGSKKKIFMGDSGSLILGYLLTFFVFNFWEINAKQPIAAIFYFPAAPATILCVLFIPLFDIVRVALTRIRHQISPFSPDRNHIHHLLLKLGLKHYQVTIILMAISLLFIALAIFCKDVNIWVQFIMSLLSGGLLIFVLWRIVDKRENI
ncbi:MAG: undecaprenyl/decaprenyl-phosphate alpha-N-acetylglucosaminyl 1-phosphate transferase [Prevotellaceae bacterium]|jgi:UDP-N-acetylmuramyl pentapeptide phosphotransferase/UDP-N-acetylglucosamine-1-phosphate transferase|nr:undecaprenyl/decaprenyl-phosphate alpha-N-acetylglucosaminyl 1-phosphate transferase [Prevotellaceae bacterium]